MVSNKPSPGRDDAGRTTGMPGRRSFLLMTGAAVGAGALSSCMRVAAVQAGAAGSAHLTRATRLAAAVAPDWAALRRDLSTHKLIQPGNRTYPASKVLFDPRFDGLEPAGIAYCRTPGDVSTCLAFVRKYGLHVRARSGGHSYAGWSSVTGGLVVDVTEMNSFRVGNGNVRVGTGTHLIDLYNHLAAHGLAVPGGSCPTVGSAGLTLGGGVGVLGRAYGLTCDNLESVQVVTADGLVRECNAGSNSDLYWACRGGGGGNFGVATAFTFRTHRLSQLVLFFLSWPWSHAFRVIAGWQAWAPSAPDALWSNLHLAASPGGTTPSVTVGGIYLGSVAGAASLLNKLYAAVRSSPSSHFLAEESYLNAMLVEAGCAGLNVNECHLPGQAPGGTLTRQPEIAKSDFFTRRLSVSGVNTLLAGVERLQRVRGAAGGTGGVALDAFGGAINRVAPSATAFVHRNALFLAQYTTVWRTGAASGGVANQHAWLRSFYASMRPFASGQAYQNYVDPDLTNWSQAYYGANYPRLQQVKAKYDPHRLFNFPQAITPHA